MGLPKQHCLVSVSGFPLAFTLRVTDVFCPFEERELPREWKKREIAKLKEMLYQKHPYYLSLNRKADTPLLSEDRQGESTQEKTVPKDEFR